MAKAGRTGEVYRVAGPVVTATGLRPRMYDVMFAGEDELMGEVIGLAGDRTIIQVYEETSGLRPGEKVLDSGQPLVVELGPGLLGSIFDGIQRPLPTLADRMGDYILRGVRANALDRTKEWAFEPKVRKGDEIHGGQLIGTIPEAEHVEHRVLAPPDVDGTVKDVREGTVNVEDVVVSLSDGVDLRPMQTWPVRRGRPVKERLTPSIPLVTGQRVFDFFFPLAKGGTAAIPGGFGTGKTVSGHQLSRWSDAKVVLYIGCGERGNEMTEVLRDFPKLVDPHTGAPLMERTVLVANTSNMPVAAREASVYTGITIAEYYRDMGYHILLMADSTSRWAEAMREISSRLEEMPGEEGFPAYLSARLSEFYERAGRATTLSGDEGSISVVGAVSPAGGDFSEPVTQGTLRIAKVFWALDTKLKERRHFPSINWLTSYSLYAPSLEDWFRKNVNEEWPAIRAWAYRVLQEESELEEIVRLVGADALPEDQQLTLEVARMIREYFLQQNAFHDVDTYFTLERQFALIEAIHRFSELAQRAQRLEVPVPDIVNLPSRSLLSRVKYEAEFEKELEAAVSQMEDEFRALEAS